MSQKPVREKNRRKDEKRTEGFAAAVQWTGANLSELKQHLFKVATFLAAELVQEMDPCNKVAIGKKTGNLYCIFTPCFVKRGMIFARYRLLDNARKFCRLLTTTEALST